MRKSLLSFLLLCVGFAVVFPSCKKEDTIKEPPVIPDQTFVEEFDTVSSAISRGWVIVNTSDPKGANVWQQDGATTAWFAAFSSKGRFAGFIGADYTSTSANSGTISNWLMSPVITFQNGDKISFYTRALQYADVDPTTGQPNGDSTDYGNRLQVLINKTNEETNVGKGTEKGMFEPVLDINPNYIFSSMNPGLYSPYAYPSTWTRFEVTVSGLTEPKRGRFAFRYFIEGGGLNGFGSGVGIDKVSFTSINHK